MANPSTISFRRVKSNNFYLSGESVNNFDDAKRIRLLECTVERLAKEYNELLSFVNKSLGVGTTIVNPPSTSDYVVLVTLSQFSLLVTSNTLRNDKKYFITDQGIMYDNGNTQYSKTLTKGADSKWYITYYDASGGFNFEEIVLP